MGVHNRSKPAGDAVSYIVGFARALEVKWRPGRQYLINVFVRPTTANGFEYEATQAGQTAQDEPEWPDVDETVDDGSVIWTGRAFGLNASDTISTRTVTPDDAAITVDAESTVGTDVLVTLSGGLVGVLYDIAVEIVTTAGDTYTEIIRLTITE